MFYLVISFIILFIGLTYVYTHQMDIAKMLYSKYDVLFNIVTDNKQKKIVLTIDDVPHDYNTFNKIINILKKHDVKCTFFVISSYVNNETKKLLIEAVKNGCHLGNHGAHDVMHAKLNNKQLNNEITECDMKLTQIYNEANVKLPKQKWFRPGCGFMNDTIYEYCKTNNYKIVLGSNYPSDPQIKLGMLNNMYVLKNLTDGDIVILHEREWTVNYLEDLIINIKKRNYEISDLDSSL